MLGEYSLNRLSPEAEIDDQRGYEQLSKSVRDTGNPMECIEPIEAALRNFASVALRRIPPKGEPHPRLIRLFYQKKIIDEQMKGGWGYFVIERPRDASPQSVMDFYIYEEGK